LEVIRAELIWGLLLLPLLAGGLCLLIRPNLPRRMLLVLAAAGHTALTLCAWSGPAEPVANGWIAIDAASLLFLTVTSLLFLAASVYAVGYLAQEQRQRQPTPTESDVDDEPLFTNFPEATFTGCLLAFLATMSLVAVSRHLGLMWVAVEATTLASAPLIYFHRNSRSLEATWKYLVICSVGIALALLGNFFLAVAARSYGGTPIPLTLDDLAAATGSLDPRWLKAAFLLLLVGYGTKMGLAPLHTWLPDAHSEAPSVVSALLSGALLNCAFLTILRVHGLLAAAGLGNFSRQMLVLFGLMSMIVAAVFLVRQADYKRMLAYSSVEHMGILALGAGIGGVAGFGALLHTVNHSLTKAMLFFAAGNILAVYHTKSTEQARGVLGILPVTGVLWIAGFLAITGSPPFGPFMSEFAVLQGTIRSGHPWIAAAYLAALALAFIGMASVVINMAYGTPEKHAVSGTAPCPPCTIPEREPLWSIVPPLALLVAVLVLGVYLPPALADVLHRAAAILHLDPL
jgi:hydrogenase-4 component F